MGRGPSHPPPPHTPARVTAMMEPLPLGKVPVCCEVSGQ
jgi:hypothetical protein